MTTDAQLRKEQKLQRIVNAYHRIFRSDEGALVLQDLRDCFGMDRPAFIPLERQGSLAYDALHAAKRDGQQDIHRHIQARLGAPAKADGEIETPAVKVVKGK